MKNYLCSLPLMKMHHQNAITSQDPAIENDPTEETVTEDTAETDSFIYYDDSDIQERLEECQNSILGKIVSEKAIHRNSIQNALSNIWCNPKGFRVEHIGDKLFHFFMDEQEDMKRIIRGNPWFFRNSWLIVHPWRRDIDAQSLEFRHAPIWIQLWGLPTQCRTKQMGIKIGSSIGTVLASELYEYPNKKLIIKIKVNLAISKPIKAGIYIGSAKDGAHWIDFRYENLPQFCFACGLIGHTEANCKLHDTRTNAESRNKNVLGPWLRYNHFGRRIMDYKDRKFSSNPTKCKNYGHFMPPIPPKMLEEMAKMSMLNHIKDHPQNHNTNEEHTKTLYVNEKGGSIIDMSQPSSSTPLWLNVL